MNIDADVLLKNAIMDGLRDAIKSKLTGYQSPLDKLVEQCVSSHNAEISELLRSSISECVGNSEFRESIKAATQSILAKTLVKKFGGELEKQVNNLKSDPTTRARITIAIEDIVRSKTA